MNASAHHPASVVIIDDNPGIRRALEQLVAVHPALHVVGTAENGAEGVEVVRACRPDVVLIDHRMPVMDGVAAARQIRADRPATWIVMLSAYDDMSIIAHATTAGVDDFLCKGVPADVLHASLLGERDRPRLRAPDAPSLVPDASRTVKS